MSPADCKTEYTLRTANEALPLVRMIVGDIVELSEDVAETRQRLSYITQGQGKRPSDEYSEELSSIQELTDEKSERLERFMDELIELSLDPTHAEHGFVDFPAQRAGQDICLCWRLGEPEVAYWHRAGEDCSCRRLVDLPIVQRSVRRQFPNPSSRA